jgi:hypothetical protein
MTQHEQIMCACGHIMEDHAWTADDAYCMMGSCLCHDFHCHDFHKPAVDYEAFRDQMLQECL